MAQPGDQRVKNISLDVEYIFLCTPPEPPWIEIGRRKKKLDWGMKSNSFNVCGTKHRNPVHTHKVERAQHTSTWH